MSSSLYLHIPFCDHKCVYCDFYSVVPGHGADEPITGFLTALEQEILLRAEESVFRSRYHTVFFGGGTPSLMHPSNIRHILDLLRDHFAIDSSAEVTLETNPGTVDEARLAGFREAGVNRLSVGIQSFHDDELRFLTRIHSSQQARDCIRRAFSAGFENVSLDLIFALPGQTLERWRMNLETAVALAPAHISCYSLIVEPHTPLQRLVDTGRVTPASDDEDAAMYEFTTGFLSGHGYRQYEVSNFCRPGYESLHNSQYWNQGNYLGFGPSAHSFWLGRRWWNVPDVARYTQSLRDGRLPVSGEETLTPGEEGTEALFLGLRSRGLDLRKFRERTGRDLLAEHRGTIEHLIRSRLATLDGVHLRLTSNGYALCDEICTRLMTSPLSESVAP